MRSTSKKEKNTGLPRVFLSFRSHVRLGETDKTGIFIEKAFWIYYNRVIYHGWTGNGGKESHYERCD